jgi:hypothetical protein
MSILKSIRYVLISLILFSSLFQLIKSNEEFDEVSSSSQSNSLTFIFEIEHSFNGNNNYYLLSII